MPGVRLPFARRRVEQPPAHASDDAAEHAAAAPPPGEAATPAPAPAPRRRLRAALTLVGALALTLVAAYVATRALDASSWPDPLAALREGRSAHPALLVSTALVWVVVLLLVAVVGRLWLALGLAAGLTTLLALVNRTKLDLRGDPLYPGDWTFLRQPDFLLDMTSPTRVAAGVGALVVLLVVAAGVGWLVARVLPPVTRHASRRTRWAVRGTRVVVAVLCLGLLNLADDFNDTGNPWRDLVEASGTEWATWNQRVNYERNGFVPGLLYNTHVQPMAVPEGYSREAVRRVVQRYEALADQRNRDRTTSLDDTNVVMVLSESFSQPAWLDGVDFGQDLIPRTTATMERTVSGRMLAPGVGHGTADTEFEALTGESLALFAPQLTLPLERLVASRDGYPSVVGWLRSHGWATLAVHPFSPRMYDRPDAYRSLGFDRFVSKSQMRHRAHDGGRFINDRSAFREVLDAIRDTDRPLFTHLVTMQNHMPYHRQYDRAIMPTSGLSGEEARLAGRYAEGINRTDAALAEMLDELRRSPEPTVVIFYGDHLPPQIYPQALLDRQDPVTVHQTPFLIWSNRAELPHTDLPTTSPTQFVPMALEALGVPAPPWYTLLDEVRRHVPAMDAGLVIGPDDQRLRRGDLDPEARAVLADYRMIQYDLAVGRRWSEQAMFAMPEPAASADPAGGLAAGTP